MRSVRPEGAAGSRLWAFVEEFPSPAGGTTDTRNPRTAEPPWAAFDICDFATFAVAGALAHPGDGQRRTIHQRQPVLHGVQGLLGATGIHRVRHHRSDGVGDAGQDRRRRGRTGADEPLLGVGLRPNNFRRYGLATRPDNRRLRRTRASETEEQLKSERLRRFFAHDNESGFATMVCAHGKRMNCV